MSSGAVALAGLVRAAGEHDAPGVHRVLPVAPELSGLLPGRGLRRGSTVAVAGGQSAPVGGSTSLLLALLAEASRAGSWCAVAGLPSLGALAAQESGIVLERLALVPDPGPDWPTVIAALIDGVDVVVAAVPGQIAPTVADRLVARARQRGSVLVPYGKWPGADVTLQVTASRWEGLAAGRGRLRRREVTILARGRGAAARPKEITLWMPGITLRPPATEHPAPTPAITPANPDRPAPPTPLRSVPSALSRARAADRSPLRVVARRQSPGVLPVRVSRALTSGVPVSWLPASVPSALFRACAADRSPLRVVARRQLSGVPAGRLSVRAAPTLMPGLSAGWPSASVPSALSCSRFAERVPLRVVRGLSSGAQASLLPMPSSLSCRRLAARPLLGAVPGAWPSGRGGWGLSPDGVGRGLAVAV